MSKWLSCAFNTSVAGIITTILSRVINRRSFSTAATVHRPLGLTSWFGGAERNSTPLVDVIYMISNGFKSMANLFIVGGITVLNQNEKALLEALDGLLKQDDVLGLSAHDNEDSDEAERGYEYLHNNIDDSFAVKAADLHHADSVIKAFHSVHSYKYVDDPSFMTAMRKEMTALAVPAKEMEQAEKMLMDVVDDLRKGDNFAEKDAGFNPDLEEIRDISQPTSDDEFEIIDKDGYMDANVDWDKEDFRMGRTPAKPESNE